MAETRDPDGRRPGGGIGLPDHYRTWPAIKDRIFYTPEPRMLVGLGNGSPQPSRFRFDLGGGSIRNVIAWWSRSHDSSAGPIGEWTTL